MININHQQVADFSFKIIRLQIVLTFFFQSATFDENNVLIYTTSNHIKFAIPQGLSMVLVIISFSFSFSLFGTSHVSL